VVAACEEKGRDEGAALAWLVVMGAGVCFFAGMAAMSKAGAILLLAASLGSLAVWGARHRSGASARRSWSGVIVLVASPGEAERAPRRRHRHDSRTEDE